MTTCLQRATDKQGQAELLGSLPETSTEAAALFEAGYGVADAQLIYAHSARRDELADLLKAPSYPRAKAAAHRWLATRAHTPPWSAYKAFFRELEQPSQDREEHLSESERVTILQLGVLTPANEQKRERLLVFIERARQVKSQLGTGIWQTITKVDQVAHFSLRSLVAVMELLLDLDGQVDTKPHLQAYAQSENYTLLQLRRALSAAHREHLARAFPEREIGEAIQRFATLAPDVQNPLDARDQQALRANFQVILNASLRAQAMSHAQAKDAALSIKARVAAGDRPTNPERMLLLAVLREGIRRHFGIQPYDTQMLVLLGLLRKPQALSGRIAQVKTGEGKSTIVAMLAAYLAITNHKVDVISSARPLAARDCERYTSFFAAFGVSASHICTDDPTPEDFHGQIIYGTNHDFEFSILRDSLFGSNLRGGRASDAVIIDEVDNLFIDKGNESAIIGAAIVDDGKWLVPAVVAFAESIDHTPTLKAISKKKSSVAPLRSFLRNYNAGQFAEAVDGMSDFQVRRLVSSYLTAYVDRQHDEHYVVRPKEIEHDPARVGRDAVQIVDLGTGQLQPACRWQHRVHQLVEHKHNLNLEDETVIAAELSHPIFFNKYQNLFGVTGTLGSDAERNEVREVYKSDAFDVPAHRPSARTCAPMLICATDEAYYSAMLDQIRSMQRANRACLVLLPTIRATEEFSAYLNEMGMGHQLLNAVQAEEEAIVVARAGRSGAVTVATNTAGRGTDILLSREVREAGGLHVIMGFYPENDRVEAQGLGRAGRQGQPGTGVLVINVRHLPEEAKRNGTPDAQSLAAYRQEVQAQQSEQRINMAHVAELHHEKMRDFFVRLSSWRHEINDAFLQQMNQYLLDRAATSQWQLRPVGLPEGHAELAHLLRLAQARGGSPSHFGDWLGQFKGRLDNEYIAAWGRCFENLKDHAEECGALASRHTLGLHGVMCNLIYDRFCDRFADYTSQPHRAFENALDAVLTGIRV